jgi:hypothetical protein
MLHGVAEMMMGRTEAGGELLQAAYDASFHMPTTLAVCDAQLAFLALRDGPEGALLEPAQRRIVDTVLREAELAGVALTGAARERFQQIEAELAEASMRFENNLLDATKAFGLVLTTNRVTVLWSFAALAITLIYPFAKRFVSIPQAVLGIAFSFGIPMAFAAVQATVPVFAAWLLAGNLFWVLAYDTEYAMVDRDDDLKIGMKTSAITFGRLDVPIVMASYAAFLAIWAYVGAQQALGRVFCAGIALATAQAIWHWRLIRNRTRDGCFKAFRLNHWLGATVFAGIVLDYALR